MKHTNAFHVLMRGLAERRKALILKGGGRSLIYPQVGKQWDASSREIALCDAFILFFVAEMEGYFEAVLEKASELYEECYKIYFLKNCRAGDKFVEMIQSKRKDIQKNNNANWGRISHLFEFFGMGKESHFPTEYWNDMESVVSHRGHLAHNGARIKVEEDRRAIMKKIEITISRTRHFDEYFSIWSLAVEKEMDRISKIELKFSPPDFHHF